MHDTVGEIGVECYACRPCRRAHDSPEFRVARRADHDLIRTEPRIPPRNVEARVGEVRPDDHDEPVGTRTRHPLRKQVSDNGRLCGSVLPDREDLLKLVDHQKGCSELDPRLLTVDRAEAAQVGQRLQELAQPVHGTSTWPDDHRRPALTSWQPASADLSHNARSNERGLAAPGRSEHGDHLGNSDPRQHVGDHALSANEQVGVLGFEAHQTLIRGLCFVGHCRS